MSGIPSKSQRVMDRNSFLSCRRRGSCGRGGVVALLLGIFCWSLSHSQSVYSQMVEIGTPMHGFGDSWFERQGVGFGFWLPGGQTDGSRVVGLLPNGHFTPDGNLHFSQGSFGGTYPPFGGYDPNSAGHLGIGVGGSGGGFRLGLEFGKGSTRTITSTSPSLMLQNGGSGFIGTGQWNPFVTGWIPVVGDFPGSGSTDNGVTRALQSGQLRLDNLGSGSSGDSNELSPKSSNSVQVEQRSSAEVGSESVAAIRSGIQAKKDAIKQEIEGRMAEYEQHLAAGKLELARLALVHAIPLETDPIRKQKLRELLRSTR